MSKAIRIATLLLLFVLLPLVSWYYLSTGAHWRNQNLSELIAVGKMPPVHYVDGAGKTHNQVDKKVCVLYVTDAPDQLSELDIRALNVLDSIYDQFHARTELRLLLACNPANRNLREYANSRRGSHTETWIITDEVNKWLEVASQAKENYRLKSNWPITEKFICLSDIQGNIKGVYSVDQPDQIIKLVQHLAILLPLK